MHGDDDFTALLHRHRDLIWRVCSDYRLSPAWEVQDAFQEVLVALWNCRTQFRGDSSERTWVYRVATSTMLSLKRRRSNQPQPLQPVPTEPSTREADEVRQLMEIVDTLEETDRLIVRANLEGFSHREVAHITGLSPLAVATRLNRAKQKIRKRYEKGF